MKPVPIANLSRALPEAGRIRTGVKTAEAMKAIDTFRFTSGDESALNQIAQLYGGTVRPWSDAKAVPGQFEVITDASEIQVALPPDPLSQHYELWGSKGCERRCDGATADVLQQGPDGPEPTDMPCLCANAGELSCRLHTRLSVILPGVQMSRGVVWRLETKSEVASEGLPGMVELVQSLQSTGLVRATLSLRHIKSGSKRYIVPQLGIPQTIEQVAAGHSRLSALPDVPAAGELGEGTGTAALPCPDDEIHDAELVEEDWRAVMRERLSGISEEMSADLRAWIEAQGFPRASEVSEDQARQVCEWLDRRNQT